MCLDLNLPHPSVPSIFLPNPDFVITINIGTVGVSCCHFTIPGVTVDLSGPIAAAIGAGGPLVLALNIAIAGMNATVDEGLAVLDQIHVPDCPRE